MGAVDDRGRRCLVDLPALDADEAVLDMVHPTHAVGARQIVEVLDQGHGVSPIAVERNWHAALEADHYLDRRRGLVGIDGPAVDVFARRCPGIFEDAGLDRAAPQVDVDRVDRVLGDRDLDVAGLGVLDLLLAAQTHADAHRGDDSQRWVQGVGGDVEADLIVALAGAAVRDRVGAFLVSDLDEELGDHRAGHGRGQRVDALVERPGLYVRPAEVAHEAVAAVDDISAAGAGADGAAIDVFLEHAAAEVHGQGHDLDVVLLAQPGDGDGRVESTGIGEHHFLHRGASECAKGSTAGSPEAPAG